MSHKIQLGLGLIGVGRKWGHINAIIPTQPQVMDLLEYAYENGIRYFDTAPSYGMSEERLGIFLHSLTPLQRKTVIVATKFGEHWDYEKEMPYTDQSFSALQQSVEKSLERLGGIDVLYLHKTTLDALKSVDVKKGFDYAKQVGVYHFGASVSDILSAEFVCNNEGYSFIQFPFNITNQKFGKIIDLAKEKKKIIVINRPFSMGELLYSDEYKNLSREVLEKKAYKFILEKDFEGYILTGTKNMNHLKENIALFNALQK